MSQSASPFTIEKALPEDSPSLVTLVQELADHFGISEDAMLGAEEFADALRNEQFHSLLVVHNESGERAAVANYNFSFSTFIGPKLTLNSIFVRPQYRKFGLGSLLMKELAKIAKERKMRKVEWDVFETNLEARGFYEKLGATNITGKDGLLMYCFKEEAIDKLCSEQA